MTDTRPVCRLDSDWRPGGATPGRLTLTLTNLSDRPLSGFRLASTSLFRIRPETPIEGGTVVEQLSNYHVIAPPEGFVLAPGARWSATADRLSHDLRHYNYGPKSAYLILADGGIAPVAITPMTRDGEAGAPHWAPAPTSPLPEGAPPIAVIPHPARVEVSGQRRATEPFRLAEGPGQAREAFAAIASLAGRLFPGDQPLFRGGNGQPCLADLDPGVPEEGYRLTFSRDVVRVSASAEAGFRHAFVTLGQILRGARPSAGFVLPADGAIDDAPRFAWRGAHLDVARQVYTVGEILRFLDCLAWNKLNRFHIHLNDDEGWRLDVPAYPALAEIAAWRGHGLAIPPLLGSPPEKHGLVYRAADIGRMVARAGELGIMVVPEIDIPGHCYSALQAVPALRDPGETGVYRSIQYFPNDALNPAVDETWRFLEAVLGTVAELFPAPFIHIGGDEVADDAWLGSPLARRLMQDHGWTEVPQLQAHFLQRAQAIVRGLGRGIGAWEEAALGGGVDAPGSYLVSWKKSESGLALARAGYDVVLAPAEHCYFDMAQSDEFWEPGASWAGTVSLADCYAFDPAGDWPEVLKPRLLGVQSCLWSENLSDRALFDHLTFPRLSAVAETAWTPRHAKNLARFQATHPLMPRTGAGSLLPSP